MINQTHLRSLPIASILAVTLVVGGLTGCAKREGRSYGQYWDDYRTAAHVKGALDDAPVYKFPSVQVTSFGQVVQLGGFVQTEDQRKRAGEIASTVPGVKEVVNNVSIRPGGGEISPAGRPNAPVRNGQP